jgi:molybdate transport system ATP-binding protein
MKPMLVESVSAKFAPDPAHMLHLEIRKALSRDFELHVSLEIPPGINILFGASGAGKTTLLDCIAGILAPDAGRIIVGERLLFESATRLNLAPQERRVGYVFQDLALFPHLRVQQNIEYGLRSTGKSDRRARTDTILESFRIAHLRARKPQELSGGERQRVALARALVTDPCVLLLDEPLAALDHRTKSRIIEDLHGWNEAHLIPVLYVTHSREEVFALGERVIVLNQGRIIAQGAPHEVMQAPISETVAQLAGVENIFDVTVVAAHEDRGTMTCRISGSLVDLETPLVRAELGAELRVGISARDVLLATIEPHGLSARNVITGKVVSLVQRDVMVIAKIDCGVEVEAQLTLAAREALVLKPGREVWLVIKTHSCHLMAG